MTSRPSANGRGYARRYGGNDLIHEVSEDVKTRRYPPWSRPMSWRREARCNTNDSGHAGPKGAASARHHARAHYLAGLDASDNVTRRRFIAAKWNTALTADQAAQASSSPVAWSGYGDKSIRPGRVGRQIGVRYKLGH